MSSKRKLKRLLVLKAPFGLRRIFVDVALREKQRFRGLLELRAHRAAVDELCGGTQRMRTSGLAGADHDVLLAARQNARVGEKQEIRENPRSFSPVFNVGGKPTGSNDHDAFS